MNKILVIVCWMFTIPTFLFEWILKGLSFVIVVIIAIVTAIFYPLLKNNFNIWFAETSLFWYATGVKGRFPLTKWVYDSWS